MIFIKLFRLLFVSLLLVGLAQVKIADAADKGFMQWLKEFQNQAIKEGISAATLESAFTGVTEPDPVVLEKARFQPEFTVEIWDYLDSRVNPLSVDKGKKMAKANNQTLAAVEQRFGVEQAILLAIWSMESNYGAILAQPENLFYVPLALSTLGYGDPKRSKYARTQLLATLKILQTGEVGRAHLMGSWAGAMGHTQFIPTSYMAYAIDMDGNGRKDIWNSIPDALATAAHLLQTNGWKKGSPWGYEVLVPTGGDRLKEESKSLVEWTKLGFKRASVAGFVRPEEKATLKMPAGPQGPAFLVFNNFAVLKRYNNSDFYAIAVGFLADQLDGTSSPLVKSWPRPAGTLNAEEKLELQKLLQDRGLYIGEVDGRIGSATSQAIRSYQAQVGLEQDGIPSQKILRALRR
jgi:membrane-bound lytic murein transglycosylase B